MAQSFLLYPLEIMFNFLDPFHGFILSVNQKLGLCGFIVFR